jgi:hypothetical protein
VCELKKCDLILTRPINSDNIQLTKSNILQNLSWELKAEGEYSIVQLNTVQYGLGCILNVFTKIT